ncbi:ABC transporter ATP-binding protein [Dyadobacter psychrotolerans]|uniref:ABC transporter ATP-binding protein n=1 Tax=Dyadobacter psychrotolerans TaxID=2541721 RepID=A0A4R5DPY9_9BACT|nr:ABC transporter ATP-binding protein [Dyadobacter psychrotolerans]TDE16406.1 ABC transporter ATP-binding protein [Dyadobacter psychrotolerans]
MIHLDKLTFGYSKHKKLFENLSMTLAPGHIYGLLGKNGAGKSSLLRNMAGLLYPLEGKIEVNGYEPKKRQPGFLQDVFFIPEEIYLPPFNISKYLSVLSPFYPKFDTEQFQQFIREFEIPKDNKLTDMSYGQKKKVLISFALAANTRVLIMDEPTNGLDIPSKSQFRKIVSSVLDPDRIILISTHQVRDLDSLIDHIIILENSEILVQHSMDTVSEKLYFGTLVNDEDNLRALYSEPSLRGFKAVTENTEQLDSRVDLEYLFNAAIKNPVRIKEIFNS